MQRFRFVPPYKSSFPFVSKQGEGYFHSGNGCCQTDPKSLDLFVTCMKNPAKPSLLRDRLSVHTNEFYCLMPTKDTTEEEPKVSAPQCLPNFHTRVLVLVTPRVRYHEDPSSFPTLIGLFSLDQDMKYHTVDIKNPCVTPS